MGMGIQEVIYTNPNQKGIQTHKDSISRALQGVVFDLFIDMHAVVIRVMLLMMGFNSN